MEHKASHHSRILMVSERSEGNNNSNMTFALGIMFVEAQKKVL